MPEKKRSLRLALVVGFALPAVYLLLFVYDSPPRVAGRELLWESYRISFKKDGTVVRGPWEGQYVRAGDNFLCLGGWERQSGGGNMISRPLGFYHFAISGGDITLTRAPDQGQLRPRHQCAQLAWPAAPAAGAPAVAGAAWRARLRLPDAPSCG